MIAEIEGFFFDAMVTRSWAKGTKALNIPGMPGWEAIKYEDKGKGLKLVDRWGKDSRGTAVGSILITMQNVPAWVMWVGAENPAQNYTKAAIPFLKKVLMGAYTNRVFKAGRGYHCETDHQFIYLNQFEGDFAKFRGTEGIVDYPHNPTSVGTHKCWGGMLI